GGGGRVFASGKDTGRRVVEAVLQYGRHAGRSDPLGWIGIVGQDVEAAGKGPPVDRRGNRGPDGGRGDEAERRGARRRRHGAERPADRRADEERGGGGARARLHRRTPPACG